MNDSEPGGPKKRPLTELAQAGRSPSITGAFVNPPVIHASTVLFSRRRQHEAGGQPYVYGRVGTPTTEALESAMTKLEGAAGTVLCPSGLSGRLDRPALGAGEPATIC